MLTSLPASACPYFSSSSLSTCPRSLGKCVFHLGIAEHPGAQRREGRGWGIRSAENAKRVTFIPPPFRECCLFVSLRRLKRTFVFPCFQTYRSAKPNQQSKILNSRIRSSKSNAPLSPIYAVILLPVAQTSAYGGNYSYLFRSSETNIGHIAPAQPPLDCLNHLSNTTRLYQIMSNEYQIPNND
jgi:hypothetical protein